MYKKFNDINNQQTSSNNQQTPSNNQQTPSNNQQTHLYHAQHKAQFNIESNKNMSLNQMKGLSHNNFISNTNNMREDYQKQHLNKSKNIQLNLGYRG